MNKILTTALILLLAFNLFCIGMFIVPSIVKSEENTSQLHKDDIANIYSQAITSPFKKVSSEIEDKQLANFYNKFVNAMQLDKEQSNISNASNSELASLLPDIKSINKIALDMPLLEAGKEITDPEIAEFYREFIQKCGVNK